MDIKLKDKGFTIIEVVLVLAIAALIFMMVFIALPALQRSQRDTQRKNDLSRATTAVGNFTAANRGALPTDWDTFTTQYLTTGGDTFIDPAGANTTNNTTATYYIFTTHDGTQLTGKFGSGTSQNIIYYTTSASCDVDGKVKDAGSKTVALRMYLEGGGIACQNN